MLGVNRGNSSSLDPDLRELARRLSFSDADSPSSGRGRSAMPRQAFFPRLQTIDENRDEPTAQAPAPLSPSTAPQPSPGAPAALYASPGGTTTAPAWPSQSQLQEAVAAPMTAQQLQDAHATVRMLEQLRQAREYLQQRHQQALAAEAGLQQARASEAAERLQSQVLMLYTVDGGAAGYETKWEELHPVSQGLLLQIEDKIREYRDDSKRLDQCNRLDGLSPFSFEFDARRITQEAVSIYTIMNRQKISTESLMTVIKEIMWSADFAICSYVKLRPRFVQLSAGAARHSLSSDAQTDFSQLLTMSPSFHCYSSSTRRPSSFVQHTVSRFEDNLGECCKWILELEQLVRMKDDKTFAETLESLSKVMSNVHDFLIHVASKVEHIHRSVETMRTRYLNDRRCRGDLSNPFVEANRREGAKEEAARRIMHPMLHLSSPGRQTTQVAVPMISSQLQQTSFPTAATPPSSYPTLPLPSVLPPSSMQTSPAPLTNPFSSPGSVFQSTPFGSFSTPVPGSTPAASLFGNVTPSFATSPSPHHPDSRGIDDMLYANWIESQNNLAS
ncbi:hypothetical protein HU200_066033 [Digitaria exilis]|uniref:Uncharacterized protein n=1 Tax=Digitaria exilis TaxID=1010633 RepID=A0A834ZZ35_9POAL|nr:hypothetical protein HU200_066033 [Digitaria exilis]